MEKRNPALDEGSKPLQAAPRNGRDARHALRNRGGRRGARVVAGPPSAAALPSGAQPQWAVPRRRKTPQAVDSGRSAPWTETAPRGANERRQVLAAGAGHRAPGWRAPRGGGATAPGVVPDTSRH